MQPVNIDLSRERGSFVEYESTLLPPTKRKKSLALVKNIKQQRKNIKSALAVGSGSGNGLGVGVKKAHSTVVFSSYPCALTNILKTAADPSITCHMKRLLDSTQ
jgi:hypothetical protein